MIYKEQLERLLRQIEERRTDLLTEMESLPEGRLVFSKQKNAERYLQRIPATGNRKKERRYGVKRKPEILSGLVHKEYIIQALKSLDANLRTIGRAVRYYKPTDENSVMGDFVENHPDLAQWIYSSLTNEDEWKNRFSRMEDYHSENLKQTTLDGTLMRSKNEIFIASRLDHYKLTYRSDCPTGVPGLYRVPDFTIRRKKDGKIIYWEHFGKMDDTDYRSDCKQKLDEYEAYGIVPWDNLIMTYDTIEGGLRADIIEAMIQGWLL